MFYLATSCSDSVGNFRRLFMLGGRQRNSDLRRQLSAKAPTASLTKSLASCAPLVVRSGGREGAPQRRGDRQSLRVHTNTIAIDWLHQQLSLIVKTSSPWKQMLNKQRKQTTKNSKQPCRAPSGEARGLCVRAPGMPRSAVNTERHTNNNNYQQPSLE